MKPLSPSRSGPARYGMAWLPVPLFLFAIVALWVADVRAVWPLPGLNWFVHYGSAAMSLTLIVVPAAAGFLANRQAALLMLGCGMLIVEIGVLAMPAGFAQSTNAAFAIYNTSALLSALCQFAGVAVISRRAIRLKQPVRWLTAIYAGGAAVAGLVIWAALTGRMPVFFIDGQGGTLLRTLAVSAAAVFFILTAGLLWKAHSRTASSFFFWYALGLLLLAGGLAGSLLIAVKDSPLQWVTRFTQLSGAVYMCVAVLTAVRRGGAAGIPLAEVEEAQQRKEFLPAVRNLLSLRSALRYGSVAAAVAVSFAAWVAATNLIGPGLPTFITFYPAVMLVALLAGPGPGVLATALAGAVVAYWVMPPAGQFFVASPVDRLALALFGAMGLFISAVAEAYRRSRHKAVAYDREEALRETRRENEFLANLLDHASQPFAVGYPDGRVGRLNRAYEELTGYTAAELSTLDWSATLTPPEWREPERQRLDELNRTGRPVRYEKEYIRKDGTRVPIELFVHLVRDREGKPEYYYSFITDVTERKRAEEKSAQLAQQRQVALDAAKLGWWHYDPITRMAYWDDGYRAIFGVSEYSRPNDEILAQIIHSEDLPALWAKVAAALNPADPQPFATEYRINRPDGVTRWIEAHGIATFEGEGLRRRAVSFVGTVADITERKQAEESLRKSEERYRAYFDTTAVGTSELGLDGRFLRVNDRMCRLTGYSYEKLMRMTPADLTHPEDREREDKPLSAFLRGERPDYQAEKRYVRKDGRIVWVQVVAAMVCNPAGKALYSTEIILDITARKASEEKLRRSAAELRASRAAALNLMEDADAARRRAELAAAAERRSLEERTRELREKEVLLKEVHHRVKNNLQVISSLVGLQADGSNDRTVREVLQDVTYRVRSMALVHEKLYQSADLARIDFSEYARSLLSYLWRAHGAAAAAVRLELELEPVSLPVDVAVPCGLILNELAGNALKHAFRGRAGGEVTVALTGPAEGRITLSVSDDGVGLPAGFDWRQTRSLGIRLVQMLAGQLDATVEIGGGEGTRFAITFGHQERERDAAHPPSSPLSVDRNPGEE